MRAPVTFETKTGEEVLAALADFVARPKTYRPATLRTAALCLIDAMGCAIAALDDPLLAALLGPISEGTTVPYGARVPGTAYVLDPVKAAFDISACLRWLDYNDTGPVGGHPSDVIGALLATCDAIGRRPAGRGGRLIGWAELLGAMVDAYEVHGWIAASNHFDQPSIGLDHVIGVRLACAAVCTRLMGGGEAQIKAALANAFLDSQSLNAYRHVPNAAPRKGWAAADAASRGVMLAWMAMRGEPGAPQPLSAPVWGFSDVHLDGEPVRLNGELATFFMDTVIFKLIPGHRLGATVAEAAFALHDVYRANRERISEIRITTHEEAIQRIAKTGALPNPAARDHCLQYMLAVALMKGSIDSDDYQDAAAANPEIDRLRGLMRVEADANYTASHLDPDHLTSPNAVELVTRDGESLGRVEVLYPVGDPARRAEALPMLKRKFLALTGRRWSAERQEAVFERLSRAPETPAASIVDLMDALAK